MYKYFHYSCNCLWVTQCHVCILLKERIFFFMCILNLVFLSLVCVSFFSPPPKLSPTLFFPQLILFFLFLQGEKSFFKPLLFLGGVAALHRGSCLYFIQSGIVLCSLDSLFSLILIAYIYSLLSCLCQYVTKRGGSR